MGLLWRLTKSARFGRELLQPRSRARRLPGQWGMMTTQGRLPTEKVFNRCLNRFVLGAEAKPAIGGTNNRGEQYQVNHD